MNTCSASSRSRVQVFREEKKGNVAPPLLLSTWFSAVSPHSDACGAATTYTVSRTRSGFGACLLPRSSCLCSSVVQRSSRGVQRRRHSDVTSSQRQQRKRRRRRKHTRGERSHRRRQRRRRRRCACAQVVARARCRHPLRMGLVLVILRKTRRERGCVQRSIHQHTSSRVPFFLSFFFCFLSSHLPLK